MNEEVVVSSRSDREIRKKVIQTGDYSLVPYEESRCKISISDVKCVDSAGYCEIEPECLVFSRNFNGIIIIGDNDCFLDEDMELVLQQMCCGEICEATFIYKDLEDALEMKITCKIHLKEVTEEQLISDWSWQRLLECGMHHKERGVTLAKQEKMVEAFNRFSKALKMIIAIEPIDPELIDEEKVQELRDTKIKLYNNLAHCQLYFGCFEGALVLCNKALALQPDNIKSLYRRSVAYSGLDMYEEAWEDIQHALRLFPNDKSAQQKAKELKPKIEKINKSYSEVIKKMFT
ncbi:peptidyl-prolyl cis-trans isomerase FKBP4 [Manduca sexta]|uniref:BDBT FKBP like N-terminal domain-containing protein n=1 Tax=Manduca sexta TaxID=7130 RepID=A0A921YMI5_MANSE|nr:peptidyl-prolyl cis-trans isomerase FKBP4 [Manduca sexta]KAG6442048.1 hypothetical protein O3G_MSEX002153 [Manduca sexta]